MGFAGLARLQFEAGDIGPARVSINRAIAARDDLPELHLLRGRIEFQAQSMDTAFTAYNDALALDPSNLEALQGVSQLGLRANRIRESEDAANRILTLDPNEPNALLVKGLHQLIRNRPDDAVASADRILERQPDSEDGLILKARALYVQRRDDDALALIQSRARADSPGVALTLLELYRAKSDAPGMLTQFVLLRRLQPDDLKLRVDEANVRYKIGDAPAARALLTDLMLTKSLDAPNAEAATRLWTEYDAEPLSPSALETIAERGSDPARLAVARYLLAHDRAAPALAVLTRARSAEVAGLRARAALRLSSASEARRQADAILAVDKTQCDALIVSSSLLVAQQPEAAKIAAQTATGQCPASVQAALALVRAHDAQGDDAGVQRSFIQALRNNKQSTRLTRLHSEWLESRGRTREAVAAGRRLTRAAPALVSGWALYRDTCKRIPAASCVAEAEAGLVAARRTFAIDLQPGELQSKGLYGRLRR